ncbi:MAG: deoxyribonuclease IV [bacterium]|nr:deoxyribonuclease IV [bacterium]
MKPTLGAHVSVAGGLYRGIENGTAIGAECIQIFGASPRQWAAGLPSVEEVKKFKDAWKASKIQSVFLHAPYLNNLASPDTVTVSKTIKNMTAHMTIANLIGATGVVFHTGSGKAEGIKEREASLQKAVATMKEILKNSPGETKLVIENVAGGGARLAATPSEIGQMIDLCNDKRVAVCYDTAHGFEAGLVKEYTQESVKKLFDDFEKAVGCERIVAIHANDSKTAFDSHHDRHENIGQGFIGKKAFEYLAAEPRLAHTHWFLEVPGYDGLGPDKKNMEVLKECRKVEK